MTIDYLLHFVPFFFPNDLWWWWWFHMMSDDGVQGNWHKFDYMEDWMDVQHQMREFELIGVDADWLHDQERAERY